MSRNRPKRGGTPQKTKKAKFSNSPSITDLQLNWKVSDIDDGGPWGWDQITCPEFLRKIWEKMRNFEKQNWGEILGTDNRRNHPISVNRIIKEARQRLRDLGHDDVEELISFRITKRQRIWAIRRQNQAFLLWWDPKHEVYPVDKRNT